MTPANRIGGGAILGALALVFGNWFASGLRRGKTPQFTRNADLGKVAERQNDPVGYWTTIVAVATLAVFSLAGAVALLVVD